MKVSLPACHSGLDPESSLSELDSRLRGNDNFGNKWSMTTDETTI
jgi:hypothetical protein